MIVEKHISFIRLFAIIWKNMLRMAALATIIVVPIVTLGLHEYTIDMTTPLILGTAISIFLGFRTNSAYERWFTARRSWGQMRAASRNLSMILSRVNEDYINRNTGKKSAIAAKVMPAMIRRNIAWLWILG